MVLETAQLLSTAVWYAGGTDLYSILPEEKRNSLLSERKIYKPTHKNHPCTIWAASNSRRWRWLYRLGIELSKEYTYRYGKIHKSQAVIEALTYPIFDSCWLEPDLDPFPQAMPDQYRSNDVVQAYRDYYINEKTNLLYYTRRKVPKWLEGLAEQKYL